MNHPKIRNAEAGDYQAIINVLAEWWGGRQMALMLTKLFFVHFRPMSFVVEDNDLIVSFVVGFVSQTLRDEGYIHFRGVHPDSQARIGPTTLRTHL